MRNALLQSLCLLFAYRLTANSASMSHAATTAEIQATLLQLDSGVWE